MINRYDKITIRVVLAIVIVLILPTLLFIGGIFKTNENKSNTKNRSEKKQTILYHEKTEKLKVPKETLTCIERDGIPKFMSDLECGINENNKKIKGKK